MTEEHAYQRLGKFTASRIKDLLKSGRSKNEYWGETALTYIEENICEIINGEPTPHVSTWATDYGLEKETDAVMWFTRITGKKVKHFGVNEAQFFEYGEHGGASPDGILIDENACLQVKCPAKSSNHSYLLRAPQEPEERLAFIKKQEWDYYVQCQFEMMATKCEKCYLAFYDDRRVDAKLRMAIFEIPLDKEVAALIDERLNKASEMLKEAINTLSKLPEISFSPVTGHDTVADATVTVHDQVNIF